MRSITLCVVSVQNGMLSNPNDQRSFYICSNGIPYLQQCPNRLVWSDINKRCDYEEKFDYPAGVVVDSFSTVYVTDSHNHRMMRWPKEATQGNIIVGGNGQGNQSNQLNSPMGLSIDQNGSLYVVDDNNHRVQRFSMKESIDSFYSIDVNEE
ncbi:unnamed protein product [Rotaria magnacalcarata]|uniref:Chitin-binding type-2 domain-containing protein n=2 Tax=Rotaria magnacalcarata TaxID=392030 RepID=A0A816BD46_9BILA|nr:unnamed protein product [Rotaria magnacalcarata]CAF4044310.1 unnamed protein product [Rotaria magnacalcarata]CAF4078231.1 unnamed protein product [Rotaria magnacalcarata]